MTRKVQFLKGFPFNVLYIVLKIIITLIVGHKRTQTIFQKQKDMDSPVLWSVLCSIIWLAREYFNEL